jgi:nucleotide-binding universal stress UspA family protein
MFHTIIVGIDGSDHDADALRLAARLGRSDAAIIETSVAPGSAVGRGLHRAARRHSADLIVVGASRRAPLGRLLAGVDAIGALRNAPCAVAIAPRGYAASDRPVALIAVAYDETPGSQRALALARQIAADADARLVACQAIGADFFPTAADARRAQAARAATRLGRLGGIEARVDVGVPIDVVPGLSADADLLVVGTRRRGPLRRAALGSVAEQLSRQVDRPLLVLPQTATRPRVLRRGVAVV